MSPSKLNSLFTGLFFAIVVALGSSVMAQDGLRLFKPYTLESFGGGRRGNDGVYSSVSGIYWSISTPTDGYIGATTTKGKDENRWVYDGTLNMFQQSNSVKISMMSPETSLATRFEVGNRRGHHGWLVSGYGKLSQSHRMSFDNMTMAVRDEGRRALSSDTVGYVLNPQSSNYPHASWITVTPQTPVTVGALWGIFGTAPDPGDPTAIDTRFAVPLPVYFSNHPDNDVDPGYVSVSSTHMSAELMYTYRTHPFTWGGMELMAGARYWDFEDKFGFLGHNRGPRAWDEESRSYIGDYVTLPGDLTSADVGNTALFEMLVNAGAENRIFGPQIGIKLSRHNARWSCGMEGRFTAGINAQSIYTRGHVTPNWLIGGDDAASMPIGFQGGNNQSFGHKKNTTVFSPIGELRFTADWQWTNAISFFGALDGMFAGNIARGVRVTDYVMTDNAVFGLRGNDRNTTVFVYGVELGIKMNR